ncbi:MAG: glutaredoxin domain-containing protein [Chthoniobacterales bacterium]
MKLYIKPWCPWCIEAVAWLEKHGYQFEKIDVLQDRAAFDHMRSISGQGLTPTLEVDGKVLPDFDTQQLERFLETHNITRP